MAYNSYDDDFDFFIWIIWVAIIFMILFPLSDGFDDKSDCLEKWSACEKVESLFGSNWEPTDDAKLREDTLD